jgi:hypothetical protein
VPSLFRRKPDDLVTKAVETVDDSAVATTTRAKAHTPSKRELGVATPKRKAGGRVVEPPPANKREAMKRMRAKQAEARREAREGMMAGKEEYLQPRDKGPERALVRNIVDARRNAASFFLPVALIVVIGASGQMPAVIRVGANLMWFALAIAVIVDSFLLTRRIKKLIPERLPKSTTPPKRHYAYAIMRSLQFRRMRIPKPAVRAGQKDF